MKWSCAAMLAAALGLSGACATPEPDTPTRSLKRAELRVTQRVRAVAVVDDAGCAVRSGALYCWGSEWSLPFVEGRARETMRVGDPPAAPFRVRLPADAVEVVMSASDGFGHGCVLVDPGDVYCWGSNSRGELGDGRCEAGVLRRVPTRVPLPQPVRRVAASRGRTCAELEDHSLRCWGGSADVPRELCDFGPRVVRLEDGSPLRAVALLEAGAAIDDGGRLYRFTHDGLAQLEPRWGLIRDVAVTHAGVCVIDKGGAVRCLPSALTPEPDARVLAIACEGETCATYSATGRLSWWFPETTPARMTIRPTIRALAISTRGGCVDERSEIRCWGGGLAGVWPAYETEPQLRAVRLPRP